MKLGYKRLWDIPSKDTHRENTLSNKTETLTKSLNIYIWAIGTLNQIFLRGCHIQIKFFKKLSGQWKTSLLFDMPILYSPFNLF